LAGDGGDELFAGNERYAKQPVFERYRTLPTPLQTGIRDALDGIIAENSRFKVLRKLRSYVDQAVVPLPERFETWNFVYREGAQIMFEPDFMRTIDPGAPFQQMSKTFAECESDDLLDRMLFYDWRFTLADNDLPKVTRMCAAAGIEVEFPMLDNAVVELSVRVPSRMKIKRLRLRTFYKEAMAQFLPTEILNKPKHGFGLPFGVWLKNHRRLAEAAFGAMSDLKKRGIIRPAFIDRLIEEHRCGHPGYYGYVIWDLVMLERWLTTRRIDLTFPGGTSATR
jgi:asparagine synthase (glutamine-hydrolysing)